MYVRCDQVRSVFDEEAVRAVLWVAMSELSREDTEDVELYLSCARQADVRHSYSRGPLEASLVSMSSEHEPAKPYGWVHGVVG